MSPQKHTFEYRMYHIAKCFIIVFSILSRVALALGSRSSKLLYSEQEIGKRSIYLKFAKHKGRTIDLSDLIGEL